MNMNIDVFGTTTGINDRELFELLRSTDLLEISNDDLASFDESTFDTTDIEIPASLLNETRFLERIPHTPPTQRLEVAAVRESTESCLFGALPVAPSPVNELYNFSVSKERFRELASLVSRAYVDVRNNCSADRVVAEPEANLLFVQRCWQLGAVATPQELNWTLLNARKDGRLTGLPRAQSFTIPKTCMDEIAFASEIAFRSIQDRVWEMEQRALSLDKLLCNPHLSGEFDLFARRLAPGFTSLEYRWAAMTLRKARRSSEPRESLPRFDHFGDVNQIRMSNIPTAAGVYFFNSGSDSTYVGVAENLRLQVDLILQATGRRILPEWIDEQPKSAGHLYLLPMAETSLSEREQQRSQLLNIRGARLNFMRNSLFSGDAA